MKCICGNCKHYRGDMEVMASALWMEPSHITSARRVRLIARRKGGRKRYEVPEDFLYTRRLPFRALFALVHLEWGRSHRLAGVCKGLFRNPGISRYRQPYRPALEMKGRVLR